MVPGACHIHLDPVGGIAGDMFLAALADLRPELAGPALEAMRAAGLPAVCRPRFVEAQSHAFRGQRFAIEETGGAPPRRDPRYTAIRSELAASSLDEAVKTRALDIYRLLAEAEATVHGTTVEAVHFHELAAWDTLADVVGAACIMEALSAAGWSLSPLPLGGGRVATQHGKLPVPAPATALLLQGFQVFDDGLPGERVTPTGAAILRHLAPAPSMPGAAHLLRGQGFGFGSRELPGIPNCLRVLALEADAARIAPGALAEDVTVVTFEVDDQAPEDLAIGLDSLRSVEGVLDVMQSPMLGKKGRLAVQVQLLCRPDALERAAAACFEETTTIGLRWQRVGRIALERVLEPGDPAVKLVTRPGGRRSAKAEASDLAGVAGGRSARREVAETAERQALRAGRQAAKGRT